MKIFLFVITLLVWALMGCAVVDAEPTPFATDAPIALEATHSPTDTATATEIVPATETKTATAAPIASATPTTTPSPRPSPTESLAPTSTSPPSATPTMTATLAAIQLAGPNITYAGISFTLDAALAENITLDLSDAPLVVAQFAFAPAGLCREVGCVTIYDTAEFQTNIPGGDSIVSQLQAMIDGTATPFIPTWGAAILIEAQTEQLAFQNGSGARAIVMRGQDGYFANNEAIIYNFHGLTADGRFYVNIEIPLDAPILLSTYDPLANSNPNAIPVPNPLPEDYFELSDAMRLYNIEAERQLEGLDTAVFSPDLTLLDALVASLLVTPNIP